MTTISFLGAAGTVTGSRHLIDHKSARILVDCGLFQGLKELRLRNWDEFIMPAEEIDYIILTHAHIDHSGFIPRLVKQGFRGQIICTDLTRRLCEILLKDSGYLQQEEARYANKKGFSKHKPALPLYTVEDAVASLKYFKVVKRNEFIHFNSEIKLRFRNAGHIPGSSIAELWLKDYDGRIKVVFTGDLGRVKTPILKDPEYVREADYLVMESTYGDRTHPDIDAADELIPLVKEIYKNRSCLVIPAFAVERTQEVIYHLRNLGRKGDIPEVPIYLDSPMAVEVTKLFEENAEEIYDKEAMDLIFKYGGSIFKAPNIHFSITQEESKSINDLKGPMIIISASGMATGGRILHHLKARLPDPKNIVLMVGYQAEGTRGRSLLEGAQLLKIHGMQVPVRAKVLNIKSFSAHADYVEMLKWLRGIKKTKPKTVFLVHGEENSLKSLSDKIRAQYIWNTYIPKYLEKVPIGRNYPPPPVVPIDVF